MAVISDGVREVVHALEEMRASQPEHTSKNPAVVKLLAPDAVLMELPDRSRWVVVVYRQSSSGETG